MRPRIARRRRAHGRLRRLERRLVPGLRIDLADVRRAVGLRLPGCSVGIRRASNLMRCVFLTALLPVSRIVRHVVVPPSVSVLLVSLAPAEIS